MIINKKMVRKNKRLRKIQREDKKANRDRKLERGCELKCNIEKVVALTSETAIGENAIGSASQIEKLSAQELIAAVEAAGLTGLSGSGFPVADKLRAFLDSDAAEKYIIINGAECEPGLLNDAWLMRNRAEAVVAGAAAMKQALAPKRIILATRGSALYLEGLDTKGLEQVRMPLRYPLGEEHLLISQVLGKKLGIDCVPAQAGILVTNVQTVYQIGRILSGSYDAGRYVTLANLKTGEARVAYVHADTGVEQALKQAFGSVDGDIYAGGGIGRAEIIQPGETFSATVLALITINGFSYIIEKVADMPTFPFIRALILWDFEAPVLQNI